MGEFVHSRWIVVLTAGCAFFLVMLDASIVGVALPTISADLHAQPALVQWALQGYLLALVSLIMPCGRWLVRVGRRASLMFGVVGFVCASVLAAVAHSLGMLVLARIAQGAFGAVVFALVPAMISEAVRPEERGRAMGLLGVFGPLGAVSGPVVGGLLTSRFGWPSIFLVNVPVGALVAALAMAVVPGGGRLTRPDRHLLVDVLLFGAAMLGVMLAVTLSPTAGPWWLLLLVPSALLLVLWSRASGTAEVLTVLRSREEGTLVAMRLLVLTAVAVPPFLVPFYLTQFRHRSSAVVGVTLLAMTAAMVAWGPMSGILADRFGARRVALVGLIALIAGLALLVNLGTAWSPLSLAWRLGILGSGLALFSAPNQSAIVGAAPDGLATVASAASGLAQNLGFAFGPALASAAWAFSDYRLPGMRVGFALAAACGVLALACGLHARSARVPMTGAHMESAGTT
ncbi:MFS transporter [Planosporangium thailandense]|uniref:MFS transporter n=1 Tax=Planosporangium thailandense TaxID=765197 RepID=A0ABX0XXC4_9ACTN|nr:MFS transporter [Planosporangium thailandense]NJC69942.1 MFS transporter [Planosporangium thailandense]